MKTLPSLCHYAPLIHLRHMALYKYFFDLIWEYYTLHQAWCETKFIKYRGNKLIVTKYVQNVHHWHEHKCVRHLSTASSISDCSKPCHSCIRRCHSSSMSWTLVWYTRCWMTDHSARHVATKLTWPQSVDYAIWSVIHLDAAGNILKVHYKSMKCDVSFSLGSVSTLFTKYQLYLFGYMWRVYAYIFISAFSSCTYKAFLPAYNSAKIIKIDQDFPELWSQMYCHLFMVHSVNWWLRIRLRFAESITHLKLMPPSPHWCSRPAGRVCTNGRRWAWSSAVHSSPSEYWFNGSRLLRRDPENNTASWQRKYNTILG